MLVGEDNLDDEMSNRKRTELQLQIKWLIALQCSCETFEKLGRLAFINKWKENFGKIIQNLDKNLVKNTG